MVFGKLLSLFRSGPGPAGAADAARLMAEGMGYLQGERLEEATTCFERLIELAPNDGEAHCNLAIALAKRKKVRAAQEHMVLAIKLRPDDPAMLANYALVLFEGNRLPEAVRTLEKAVRRSPDNVDWLCNLAAICRDLGRLEESLAWCERALALAPDHAAALGLKGGLCFDFGRYEEAEAILAAQVKRDGLDGAAASYYGFLMLGQQRFAEGWWAYRSRKLGLDYRLGDTGVAEWQGQPLAGRRVIVHAEQGLGDEIMFASCFPDLAGTGVAEAVIGCDRRLLTLFRRSFADFGNLRFVERKALDDGEGIRPDDFDYRLLSGDLPEYFRPDVAAFPGHRAFLTAAPDRVAHWRRLLADRPGRKIGLCWRGGLGATRQAVRSLGLGPLLSRLAGSGAHCFPLQFRPTAAEQAEWQAVAGVADVPAVPTMAAADYDELAAFITALDGVVSVCGATVHLAGALGVDTLVLVPRLAEWRYGFQGDGMLWYPSVRLLRQTTAGDWSDVLDRAAASVMAPAPAETGRRPA